MPPGSEVLLPDVLKNIVVQGPVFGLLVAFLLYFIAECKRERQAHSKTTDRLVDLTEESTKASVTMTAALAGLEKLMERIAYDRGNRANER